jgi:uncharacterized membrane protein
MEGCVLITQMQTVDLLSYYFVLFCIYGFAGFTAQTLYTEFARRFVRNIVAQDFFYFLPLTPLFGFGALALVLIFDGVRLPINQPWLAFVISLTVGTVFEYATGKLIEYLQGHNDFWSYADQPFNFQGQICLLSSVLFGVVGILVINVIQPVLRQLLLETLWARELRTIAAILVVLFTADSIYSFWQRCRRGKLV